MTVVGREILGSLLEGLQEACLIYNRLRKSIVLAEKSVWKFQEQLQPSDLLDKQWIYPKWSLDVNFVEGR